MRQLLTGMQEGLEWPAYMKRPEKTKLRQDKASVSMYIVGAV